MVRRRSLAVLALMVVLTFAPSLALAAAVCAPHCCPAAALDAAREGGDCRAGFASRSCCNEAVAPDSLAAPAVVDGPALPVRPAAIVSAPPAPRPASQHRDEAWLALRTSPLRLSVVLLI